MEIKHCTNGDIDIIFELFDAATAHQKTVATKHWLGFERSLIEEDIADKRKFKIVQDGQIACVFAITHNDAHIWGKEADAQPAVYIHRIATNPAFRGHSFVKTIVAWAKDFSKANHRDFIRMDTGGGNDKLNNYYISCGFDYLGLRQLGDVLELPAHYRNGSSALFEIKVV